MDLLPDPSSRWEVLTLERELTKLLLTKEVTDFGDSRGVSSCRIAQASQTRSTNQHAHPGMVGELPHLNRDAAHLQ